MFTGQDGHVYTLMEDGTHKPYLYELSDDGKEITLDTQELKELLRSTRFIGDNELLYLTHYQKGNIDIVEINLRPVLEYAIFENFVLIMDSLRNLDLDCIPMYDMFESPRVITLTTDTRFKLSNVLTDFNNEKTVHAFV